MYAAFAPNGANAYFSMRGDDDEAGCDDCRTRSGWYCGDGERDSRGAAREYHECESEYHGRFSSTWS